jgi:hypothetical protein
MRESIMGLHRELNNGTRVILGTGVMAREDAEIPAVLKINLEPANVTAFCHL